MARRYRYAIIKKKEPGKGKLSVGLAIASLLLFVAAVTAAYMLGGKFGFIIGGVCLFAALLSAYGFVMGLYSGVERSSQGTYQASCGTTANDMPTMRSLKRSKPVVSVSKQNSG